MPVALALLALVGVAAPSLRIELAEARETSGRGLLPGDAGITLPARAAEEELARVLSHAASLPASELLVAFELTRPTGRRLAFRHCRGQPFLQIRGAARRCTADFSRRRALDLQVERTRSAPWRPHRTYRLGAHQTGNPAVTYYLSSDDPAALAARLDQLLTLGTPFVYHRVAREFLPWLDRFRAKVTSHHPEICRLDERRREWIRGLEVSRSFGRRHSYMSPEEYRRFDRWVEEIALVAEVLASPIEGKPDFTQVVHCIASVSPNQPWALFDAGLLIDIAIYEAQAVRRDPHRVLTAPSLRTRQLLFQAAFAEALYGQLLSVPSKRTRASSSALAAEALGDRLPPIHRVLLELEIAVAGESADVARAVRLMLEHLEPRRADQPLFATWAISTASADLLNRAERLHELLAAASAAERPVTSLVSDGERDPRDLLALLGGFGANRFYALYDLSPALVDAGLYGRVGPLLFWGAVFHFQLQQSELSQPDGSLKSYHFWSEAFLGCLLRDAGFTRETASRAGEIIGEHYRLGMTPLYLSYQLYHRGDFAWVFEDNRRAVDLHGRGARFGYDACDRSAPP